MLQFTIIDYTTNPLGISTVIDEPIGWDGINLRMKRDKVWHGFFDFADDSVASLQFVGDGFGILKTAYETYGASANVQLLIEFQCADGDPYEQLYLGRFVFSTYKDTCGDECFSEITLEALDCLMIFRNRYDQQVDLDSLNTFDKVCTEFDDDVVAEFVAPHTINVLGEFAGTIDGVQIVITDSASNNGTFTVVSYSFDPFYDRSTFVVAESITNEAYNGVHLQGCLLLLTLLDYAGLDKQIVLPAKDIYYSANMIGADAYTINLQYDYFGETVEQGLPNDSYAFSASVPNLELYNKDLPDMFSLNSEVYNTANNQPAASIQPAFTFNVTEAIACQAQLVLNCHIQGGIYDDYNADRTVDFWVTISVGAEWATSTVIDELHIHYTESIGNIHTEPFNFTVTDLPITIANNQSIFLFIHQKTIYTFGGLGDPNGKIEARVSAGAYLRMSVDSLCSPTNASIYMVNETLSRCVESYTNDCMRVYSDYFGRTDAEPYPSDTDGCGGLRAITNGLRIRNAPNSDGATPQKMNVSMQDMFNALNSTDNIGMGLEDDPNRIDHKLIRVEPQEYFYNNTILMECDSIRVVKRQVDLSMIYSTIKTGYSKWKTWNVNGLNDVFAPRTYRTELSELKNELDITCNFIASDYAIEWTRRQYGLTTADSRYDNDIFLLCLNREKYNYSVQGQFVAQGSGTVASAIVLQGQNFDFSIGDTFTITGTTLNDGTYTISAFQAGAFGTTLLSVVEAIAVEPAISFVIQQTNTPLRVEQGLDSATNILFPDTVMNYRLAPSRNAMRWMKSILRSYRNFITKSIKFTNGEGNILASGEVLTPCRLENAPIAENQDISLDNFADPTANYPLFYPELVTFEYPMTYVQYLTVKANPYGLIGYQCGSSAMEYGWIEDMQYSPYNGLVNFTLRPKIV
jgi:hypothetical protein